MPCCTLMRPTDPEEDSCVYDSDAEHWTVRRPRHFPPSVHDLRRCADVHQHVHRHNTGNLPHGVRHRVGRRVGATHGPICFPCRTWKNNDCSSAASDAPACVLDHRQSWCSTLHRPLQLDTTSTKPTASTGTATCGALRIVTHGLCVCWL
jgi:hypothetical protein